MKEKLSNLLTNSKFYTGLAVIATLSSSYTMYKAGRFKGIRDVQDGINNAIDRGEEIEIRL